MVSTRSSLRRRGSTSRLQQRLQLALLSRAGRKGSLVEKGFTLVELMIVIAIVGILTAIAFPQFVGYRAKAELTKQIYEASSRAKECGISIIEGVPITISSSSMTGFTLEGKCGGTGSDSPLKITTQKATANTNNVKCGEIQLAANKNCIIKVNSETGQVTYESAT